MAKIFCNEDAFDMEYVPEIFNHRNGQLRELAACIRPALRGHKPVNALIHGPPATGKTTSIKVVFSQLDFTAMHVNCHIDNSPYAIVARIYETIFGRQAPETGTSLNALYGKILRKIKNPLMVALDDFDALSKTDRNEVLYNILRAYELGKGIKTSVWAVAQREELMLDARVRSVFQPACIRFPPYSKKELKGILKERVKTGFTPGAMPVPLLDKIADYASCHDLRMGIEAMRRAALNAENDGSPRVLEKHLCFSSYAGAEEKILARIREKPLTSGELYKLLEKEMGYTKFNKIMNELAAKNIIESKFTQSNKGRTRIFSVK